VSIDEDKGLNEVAERPTRFEETHTSMLLFLEDRVLKLRKPVRFGFLDFRSRAARREDCRREVELNRRLAPDAYLGVADIVLEGAAIDHMVVMRRFPDECNLARMALGGEELSGPLKSIAEVLAGFHRQAERSSIIDAEATGEALLKGWQDNFAETEAFVGSLLDADLEAEIRALVTRWIAGRGPLLADRIAQGCICDGHGDLQATDIFCLEDGVQILDCLEFSDRLRYGDVVSDVAFLAMDLERLGRSEAAAHFVLDYEEATGDRFSTSLFHFYCAARAYVRAKVACLRFLQGFGPARAEALALQALAVDHLRRGRVIMVLVGGLPGSGKSTLARGLAAVLPGAHLRSDEIRRDQAASLGIPEHGKDSDRYSSEAKSRVYGELLRRARGRLEMGESVVLDATWVDPAWREQARAAAAETSSEIVELLCEVDDATASARLAHRLAEGSDLSEATPAVRKAMEHAMAEWTSATVIDTSRHEPGEVLAQALGILVGRERLPSPGPAG
jgi:uncharacterized protein